MRPSCGVRRRTHLFKGNIEPQGRHLALFSIPKGIIPWTDRQDVMQSMQDGHVWCKCWFRIVVGLPQISSWILSTLHRQGLIASYVRLEPIRIDQRQPVVRSAASAPTSRRKTPQTLSKCLPWPRGMYQRYAVSTYCNMCGGVTYRTRQAHTSCVSCRSGTFANKWKATNMAFCSTCAPGTYQEYVRYSYCADGSCQPNPGNHCCAYYPSRTLRHTERRIVGSFVRIVLLGPSKSTKGILIAISVRRVFKFPARERTVVFTAPLEHLAKGRRRRVRRFVRSFLLGRINNTRYTLTETRVRRGRTIPTPERRVVFTARGTFGKREKATRRKVCKTFPPGSLQANEGYSYCNACPRSTYQSKPDSTGYMGCVISRYTSDKVSKGKKAFFLC